VGLESVMTDIDRRLHEKSLLSFTQAGWHQVEPAQFQPNWHISSIADHLEAVAHGDVRRLIVTLPPRHAKSLFAGVFFPAWVWAQNPDPAREGHGLAVRPGSHLGAGVKFAFISYAQDLSNDHSRKTRQLVEGPWFQRQWANRVQLRRDANRVERFDTVAGGHRLALSFTGKITGFGADIVVIDDAHNIREAESTAIREDVLRTWDETLPTRLNDPKTGAFIVIMQRSHERDLVGHILAKETGWTHLCLPARYEPDHPHPIMTAVRRRHRGEIWDDPRAPGEPLWRERFDETTLTEWEGRLGSYATAGQLQQRPAPRAGGAFKREWFEVVSELPAAARALQCRAWDLAGTEENIKTDPDYTVGLKMFRDPVTGIFYIGDVRRGRYSPAGVEATIKTTATQDGYACRIRIPQDPGQAGKFQVRTFAGKLAGYPLSIEPEVGSKESRADPFAAQCEVGNVKLLRGDWNDTFLDELCVFPKGSHDDQVDAATAAFRVLANMQGATAASSIQTLS